MNDFLPTVQAPRDSSPMSRRALLRAGALAGAGVVGARMWVPQRALAGSSDVVGTSVITAAGPLDTVVFGDAASETGHALTATGSDIVAGQLGQSARVLNPPATAGFWGGTTAFTLQVDPKAANYVTVKFWGGDFAPTENDTWRLHFTVNGDVLGWLDQGVVDNVDLMDVAPRRTGGFYCHTLPLPLSATQGQTEVQLEILSMGRIWVYGSTAAEFFQDMTTASRGIYRAYTHTDPYFQPASDDDYGTTPTPTLAPNIDAAQIAAVTQAVLADQIALVYKKYAPTMDYYAFTTIARGYRWPESAAYNNPDALEQLCQAFDGMYLAWQADDTVLTLGQGWEGFGRNAAALCLVWDDIQDELALNVTPGPTYLFNLGFEYGDDTTVYGWEATSWANDGTFARSTTEVYSGSAGSLQAISSGKDLVVQSAQWALVGQGSFTFSVWVQTGGTANTARAGVEFRNSAGTSLASPAMVYATEATTDWQQITATVTVPAGAAGYAFRLGVGSGATVYFDDLEITAPVAANTNPVRAAAYTQMMLASREYWRQNQRVFTNQVMYCTIGIYTCNRALMLLSPEDAWTEAEAKAWLYQAVGLDPLAGSQTEAGAWTWDLGPDYYSVTPKGLSRELGFVGTYGETTGIIARMYEAVTQGPGGAPDQTLLNRMVTMAKARTWFRYPAADPNGYQAVRMETQIGWRNEPYPGAVTYAIYLDKDTNPVMAAAVFGDTDLIGYTQQMVADNQLGPLLELNYSDISTDTRTALNAFQFVAEHLPAFQAQSASAARLPGGTWDQPDFVFTDEVNACFAIKHGEQILYGDLYFRARQAVNDMARVHLVTPQSERSATIRVTTVFDKNPDDTFTIQDWVTWDYGIADPDSGVEVPGGGFTPPAGPALTQAFAGQTLYLAPIPSNIPDPMMGSTALGSMEIIAGKAPFYVLQYAGYIVAMNTGSRAVTYQFTGCQSALNLQTGKTIDLCLPVWVPPLSTLVLYNASSL
jgi:hypothetical protein